MNKYFDKNRQLWNGWAKLHKDSDFYDVKGFKEGNNSLKSIELEELRDVKDKSLLHLQCHFGLDTLSWTRMGAKATGVDFSGDAINIASEIANDLKIDARFIHSNIYELEDKLNDKFDIVFTSYGVLVWLNDLNKWAKTIAHFLKPGGIFYMVEFHPVYDMLYEDGKSLVNPYFFNEEPFHYEKNQGSYAVSDTDFCHDSYEWFHSLSETINSLINAGLKIEFLHEFPYSVYPVSEFFEEFEPGKWRYKNLSSVPITYSLKASKPTN